MSSTLKFSDGEEFDVTGPLRLEKRYDGWYVLGNNRMIPVRDEHHGLEIIKNATDITKHKDS
jgi:hypothetical protein